MNAKTLLLILFILTVAAQWYVPANMILEREKVLNSGKEFRFRAAPIDPSDPFRGKYITLSFRENRFSVPGTSTWRENEDVFVLLTTDVDGFARIQSVSKEEPNNGVDHVKAKVNYISGDKKELIIGYPFDRFYMEESKAPRAEQAYQQALRDTSQVTYALVNVKGSEAVLKDVRINGISITELAGRATQ